MLGPAGEAQLEELRQAHQSLRAEHNDLSFQVAVLRKSLERSSVLRPLGLRQETLLATVERVFEVEPVALSPLWARGGALARLRGSCRALKESLDAVRGRKLHVVGGMGANPGKKHCLDSWECLSLDGSREGGTWETLPPMHCARAAHAGAVVGDSFYVCGGAPPACSVLKWSLRDRRWRSAPSMSRSRCDPVAVAIGQRLYVCGGYDGAQVWSCMERLSPHLPGRSGGEGGAWEELPAMSEARCLAAGVALRGHVFVCGGSSAPSGRTSGASLTCSTEAYSPLAGRWRPLRPLQPPCFGHAAVEFRGSAYVCGGACATDEIQSSTCPDARLCLTAALQRYDMEADAWFALPPLLQPRYGHSAASLSGQLYVCGGFLNLPRRGEPAKSSVERMPLPDGSWETLQPMVQCRAVFCAVALPSPDVREA